MKIYELAKKISNFVWDVDIYEAKDQFGEGGFGELVSETIMALSSKDRAKGIYKWLTEFASESRIPEDAEYALKLAREVNAL